MRTRMIFSEHRKQGKVTDVFCSLVERRPGEYEAEMAAYVKKHGGDTIWHLAGVVDVVFPKDENNPKMYDFMRTAFRMVQRLDLLTGARPHMVMLEFLLALAFKAGVEHGRREAQATSNNPVA